MSSPKYIRYHGLLLPPSAHSMESLEFAQNFSVEDTDVFAVTYPKSGRVYSFSYLLPLFSCFHGMCYVLLTIVSMIYVCPPS